MQQNMARFLTKAEWATYGKNTVFSKRNPFRQFNQKTVADAFQRVEYT